MDYSEAIKMTLDAIEIERKVRADEIVDLDKMADRLEPLSVKFMKGLVNG